MAGGTPLSASSLYFVKPPVAPIVLLIPVPALKHDCRVAVIPPFGSAAFPKRMLQTCGGIGRIHTPACMHKCCHGVCGVCKLPVLGRRPGFDPLVFEFYTKAGLLWGRIQDCSYFGFTIDQSPDLDHGRTYLPVLRPCWSSTCLNRRCRHCREWEESISHTPVWLALISACRSCSESLNRYFIIGYIFVCGLVLFSWWLFNAVLKRHESNYSRHSFPIFPCVCSCGPNLGRFMRSEYSLLDSLKWTNRFWPALLVIREPYQAERKLV